MAYTTAADIEKYFNGIDYEDSEGNPTNISEANVEQFIDEQTIVIDLTIGKKYILPITDSSDLTYLKLVCDRLVICQIDKTLRAYATDDEPEFVRKRNYCKEAQEMLKKIMDGEIPLNTNQKSFSAFSYNKTTVYEDGCCKQEKVCDEQELFSVELSAQSRLLMDKLAAHATGLSVKNSMNLIGRQYRKEVDLIFARKQVRQPSLKWPELKPKTLADKRRKGFADKGTLQRTGDLRRSMTKRNHPNNITQIGRNFGVFGSSNKYGNYHDNIKSPRSKLPLRNFSIPSESTFGVFLRTIDEDIKEQLKFIGIDTK